MRWRRHARLLVRGLAASVVLAGALTGLGSAAASAASCENWTGQQPPDPGSSENFLLGVAVLSPCDAWAVGGAAGGGVLSTLAEHWDGAAWSVVPSPDPGAGTFDELLAVRGVSADDIWAVGTYFSNGTYLTLILHWDGIAWTQVPSPSPSTAGSTLAAVRPVSANDAWAVGSYLQGNVSKDLILHWNGATWNRARIPGPVPGSQLQGVTATSSRNAWAVGSSDPGKTLILHWNGSRWTQVPSPDPDGDDYLDAVGNTSSASAWAVGVGYDHGTDRTLILHWNGSTWTHVASPDPGGPRANNGLNGVFAVSPGSAWAVGDTADGAKTLLLHWDGARWAQVTSPSPGAGASTLYAVAAWSATDLWAVGDDGTSPTQALAVHCC